MMKKTIIQQRLKSFLEIPIRGVPVSIFGVAHSWAATTFTLCILVIGFRPKRWWLWFFALLPKLYHWRALLHNLATFVESGVPWEGAAVCTFVWEIPCIESNWCADISLHWIRRGLYFSFWRDRADDVFFVLRHQPFLNCFSTGCCWWQKATLSMFSQLLGLVSTDVRLLFLFLLVNCRCWAFFVVYEFQLRRWDELGRCPGCACSRPIWTPPYRHWLLCWYFHWLLLL